MPHRPSCFHCGEPLPAGRPIYARVGNGHQPVCCIGCRAVAEFIDASGLGAFYEHRREPQPELGLKVEPGRWDHYDEQEVRRRFVHVDDGEATATVEIGGIYCSACVWLLDNAIGRQEAVRSVSINPATRRAVIRWDDAALSFGGLLDSIAGLGFKPRPAGVGTGASDHSEEQRAALRRLIVAAAAGMQVMMFAVALYAGAHYGIEGRIEQFLRVVSLLVCTPVVLYSARPFFAGAWRGLRRRRPGMDLPVSIAIAAAYAASTVAVFRGSGVIYFDSVAMFVVFLSAARYLEMRARHRSDDHTQALATLLPETVTRVENGRPTVVGRDRLGAGDIVLIRPGDVLPADGRVISGDLAIDESMLTGESLPVTRRAGMAVYAGGINRAGNASVEVTETGAATSLAEIGRLLERARADRPPVALLADRLAARFVIGVLLVAAATLGTWLAIDPARAFEVTLATLVVTCPCALALATPAALASSASRLARDGFLLVRSRVLDVLARPAVIVFDKTGTLTEGRPTIVETAVLDAATGGENRCLAIAAAVEIASEHVLARAFAPYRDDRLDCSEPRAEAGAGAEGVVDGRRYRVGSAAWVAGLSGVTAPVARDGDELTAAWLGDEHGLVARFAIGDALRGDAAHAVARLRALGHRPAIASGDRASAVARAAREVGIERWQAALSPDGKLDMIRALQATGERVVMVGDGINDAPVLQAADASIAIDAGTALARASADAVVLGKRLGSVADGAELARATRRIIRQNIGWAIAYNVTAIPLAAAGTLAPWMAALGMSASSLIVVFNALRLQRAGALPAPAGRGEARRAAGEALA